MNPRPLDPQSSALPAALHPAITCLTIIAHPIRKCKGNFHSNGRFFYKKMTALIQGVSEKQKYSLSYDALWFQFFYIGSGFSCFLQKSLPLLPRLWYDTDKRNDADMPRHAAYLITKHRQNHSKGELCMIDFQNASLFKLRKDSRPKLDQIGRAHV